MGAADIAGALKRNNITITPDQVLLEAPLTELGLHTVKVRLSGETESELKVWVVRSVTEEDTSEES